MYERFTDRARKVMQLANQEAQRFSHEYIGTEHVLIGLLKEGTGVAANALKNLDLDLRKIRLQVEGIVAPNVIAEQVVLGKLPHTPNVKRTIENAIAEANGLKHNYVGTEHLLLGLLSADGVAGDVLKNLGVTHDRLRAEVISLLAGNAPEPSPLPPLRTEPATEVEVLQACRTVSESTAKITAARVAFELAAQAYSDAVRESQKARKVLADLVSGPISFPVDFHFKTMDEPKPPEPEKPPEKPRGREFI